jgi:hypothetical protein
VPRREIIFFFMYTILLPDDVQSNRPKHVRNIENLLHSCQLYFSEYKKVNLVELNVKCSYERRK